MEDQGILNAIKSRFGLDENDVLTFATIMNSLQGQGNNQAQTQPPKRDLTNELTMQLSQAQRERSLQVKTAIEGDNRIRNLSDSEYVQFALTTEGLDMEEVCEKAYLLQCFREEYRIEDTIEEGLELYYQLTEQQPGFLLAIEYLQTSDNYMAVQDFAALFPSTIKDQEDGYRVFLGGIFYLFQGLNPNFRSIRHGTSIMVECMDASFDNFDNQWREKVIHELCNHYPQKVLERFYLNAPTVVHMLIALSRRLLPKKLKDAFHICHPVAGLEGRRIDAIYKTSTPEKARQTMIMKLLVLLFMRYTNQRDFSLSDDASAENPPQET